MEKGNCRQFFGIVLPKELLADREMKIVDKLLYGYIASYKKWCAESNHSIADKIGVSASSVAHGIARLAEKGLVFVEKVNGNNSSRRIYPVFGRPNQLAYLRKKSCKMGCGKPVENSEGVVQNMHEVVQNLHYSKQGETCKICTHKNKRIKKNKGKSEKIRCAESPPKAGAEAFGGLPRMRRGSVEFERQFYERNTIRLGAI